MNMRDRFRSVFWRVIHNCIAHPLIGIFGWNAFTDYLHRWSAEKWKI